MLHRITVLPAELNIDAATGDNLLSVLRRAGLVPDSPCGGAGHCGKCKVRIDGKEVLACQTVVTGSITVTLPAVGPENIPTEGIGSQDSICPVRDGYLLAFDIGTNGKMVLGNKDRMAACSAAAGPALERANITCGMRAAAGGRS